MKEQFDVIGMHCASCALNIEKTLKKVPGVVACHVNYANEKATIEFNTNHVDTEYLSNTIKPLGYSLSIQKDSQHTEHPNNSALSNLKNEILIGLIFTSITILPMIWDVLSEFMLIRKMPVAIEEFFHHLLPLFATYTMFVIGKQYILGVTNFAKHRIANMNTLIGIGTLVAFTYSFVVSALETLLPPFLNIDHTYYDVVIVVISLVSYGKYLEAKSKLKTGEAIEKLLNLQAKFALVERDTITLELPIEQVLVGDIIIVKPGGKIPVDGIIVQGYSSIDESMITGESIPVDKTINCEVIAGTINKQGMFKFRATKVGAETLLAHIVKMVAEAQGSRAPIQKMADRISAIFVPIVLAISILSFLTWVIIGSQFIQMNQAISLGIFSFIGVLVIACPCALGLATPTAIIVGTGKGAENGILIRDAESLELLSKISTIVLDKTGTITTGSPTVTDIIALSDFDELKILSIMGSIEKYSEHPLAEAVVKKANELDVKFSEVENFSIIEGKGLTGTVNNIKYNIGNISYINDLKLDFDISKVNLLTSQGKTPVILASSDKVLAIIGVADTIKTNVHDTIIELNRLGIEVILMSGDNINTANHIAKLAGINNVIAQVLPQDKAIKIKELKQQGKIVAMVGDGVNDAPALAEANIGIAMGTGTDVAIESSQITLLKGDISKLLKAIKLSRITMKTIKQNLFWAFIYNLIGIPLAAGLFYPIFGVLLNPIFAGFAMSFSSVSVITNSLRFKFKQL